MELSDNDDVDDKKRHVTFGSESIISEMPIDPDKYDQSVNKEEEKMMLEKIKGLLSQMFIFVDTRA